MNMYIKIEIKKDIYEEICNLLNKSRESIISSVNSTMTKTYYLIGKWFVEEEQNGNERAEYGKKLIKELSEQLLKENHAKVMYELPTEKIER